MRTVATTLLLGALSLRLCQNKPGEPRANQPLPRAAASAAEPAAPLAAPARAEPRIGGNVSAVGDYAVELAVEREGLVEADVSASTGRPLHDGVQVVVYLLPQPRVPIRLAYSSERQRFVGQAAANTRLESGPAQVELTVNGQAITGRSEHVVARARAQRGGHLLSVGNFSVEFVARSDGALSASVYDASGTPLTDPELAPRVSLRTRNHRAETVPLRWAPAQRLYVGAASSTPEPLFVELAIEADGFVKRGRHQNVAVAPAPAHGGTLVLTGYYSLELVRGEGLLSAFVYDALARPFPQNYLTLQLAVGAGNGDAARTLRWNPAKNAYTLPIAEADNLTRPFRVALTVGEHIHHGSHAALPRL